MRHRRRRLLALSSGVVVAYALIMTFGGCADRLILPPIPPSITSNDVQVHRRALVTGGIVIEIFAARSPGAANNEARAFVLRFTGGDAAPAATFTASRWRDRPVEVWCANYPGYGGSTGPRTLRALADASLAVFDQAKRVAGERPIFVEGFSLGTVPALHVAANRPVAGLILQNPPPVPEMVWSHGWWNLWLLAAPVAWQVPQDFDSIANAARSKAPAVFLVAECDESVPPKFQMRIVDAYAGPNRMILQRGAGHVTPLSAEDETQLQDAMSWLWNQALPPSGK